MLDSYAHIKRSLDTHHHFSDEQVSAFHDLVVFKHAAKHTALLKTGHICSFLLIVLKGSLRLYNEEHEQTINFFTENDWAADHESFLKQRPSANQIQATEDTDYAVISLQNIHKLIETNAEFLLLTRLLGRLPKPEELSAYNTAPQDRYTMLMKQHPEWIIRFPQKHLASYLGMTPETFSRMKRKTLFS